VNNDLGKRKRQEKGEEKGGEENSYEMEEKGGVGRGWRAGKDDKRITAIGCSSR
jgi:hypothetical protein